MVRLVGELNPDDLYGEESFLEVFTLDPLLKRPSLLFVVAICYEIATANR